MKKTYTFNLEVSDHKLLKIEAAKADVTMGELIQLMVQERAKGDK